MTVFDPVDADTLSKEHKKEAPRLLIFLKQKEMIVLRVEAAQTNEVSANTTTRKMQNLQLSHLNMC